ncbi:D-alanyl-D-alanine carboxypeptidase [Nocardia tenerifensis]|uniref:D-alanyl-D-alanine carboxypeptidase n=1 Tax=Nocardia tenerifensis TaxID=228006 RepID=A0A318KB13_9NOCA|nr:serine hydrolase domain-containing protein [Nocardia tenerifensis]PXX71306.1 D-alanyl-D-alanine carboxypeptidase [Nocardia tenerifensis]
MRRSTIRLSATAAVATILATACSTGPHPATERPKIIAALNKLVFTDHLPGAQLVLTEHGKVWTATAGVGDLELNTPFPDNARIRIASNTKTFVATVVLQLTAEGKVELDAPVARYLPGVVHGPGIDGDRITVRNLLQHTSGLPDYAAEVGGEPLPGQVDYTGERARWRTADPAEIVRDALTAPADFAPGTRWSYSNTNYALAGMVIEKITGSTVAAEVTRRIIEPLKLPDTYYPAPDETTIRGPHPKGYSTIDGRRADYTSQNVSSAGAAGAMVATGADLNRFFTALLDGKLLPPMQLAEMKHTVPTEDPSMSYGLGLFHRSLPCGPDAWGHGGDIDGFHTRGDVAGGRAVTLTVNQVPDTDRAADDVMAAVDIALCATP